MLQKFFKKFLLPINDAVPVVQLEIKRHTYAIRRNLFLMTSALLVLIYVFAHNPNGTLKIQSFFFFKFENSIELPFGGLWFLAFVMLFEGVNYGMNLFKDIKDWKHKVGANALSHEFEMQKSTYKKSAYIHNLIISQSLNSRKYLKSLGIATMLQLWLLDIIAPALYLLFVLGFLIYCSFER